MPYCPKCREEFQNWVTECLNCSTPLVDKAAVGNNNSTHIAETHNQKHSDWYIGFIIIAIGAAFIGWAVIWGRNDPTSMSPIVPFMIGAVIGLIGLLWVIPICIKIFIDKIKKRKI